ncbi:HAMP domain-containing histidine kinase [bacterium]|nr:HAMP domain-containing histidine kinase [bacterium]
MKWKIISIVLLVVLLSVLVVVHAKWWPWMMDALKSLQVAERNTTNLRIYCTISDEISHILASHATALLEFEMERAGNEHGERYIKDLASLPGVKDAFYIRLLDMDVRSVNEILPQGLLQKLDMRENKHCGGAAQMMRRLVGGLTRFNSIEFDGQRFPLMVRYIGTYYPSRAEEIIGIVLDEEWFVNQIPGRLDSLAKNSTNILFMAPQPPDTQWFSDDDPYKEFWKQTMGVIHGKDTLWWYGDKDTRIYHYTGAKDEDDLDYGYIVPVPDFNLKFLIKTEFPMNRKKVIAGMKSVKTVFPLIEITGVMLITILIVFISLTITRAKRNRIALAHLAHAIRTPVARIRINTDSMLKNLSTSPEEEQEIISDINTECQRLEGAVKGSVLALEGIGARQNRIPIDLLPEMETTINRWRLRFEREGVRLTSSLPQATRTIKGDPEMIIALLDNLLDNALRHTSLQQTKSTDSVLEVILGLDISGDHAIITVDDQGGGISDTDSKLIFKRFGKARASAGSGATGLGLGLALVKEIVIAHGGKVSVSDNQRGGSIFTVSLPTT